NSITIDCTNLIIIATSNAASEEMRQYYIEHGYSNNFQEYLIKTLIENGYFSPELINRFDDVIYYKPLSDSDLFKVVVKELVDLAQRLKQDKEIEISWNDGLIKDILIQGYDPVF